jgi:SAM-dependent methyltransferase
MKLPGSSYDGRHAELYDLFYEQKSYVDEARFVHECVQKYGQGQAHRLLDLACGTGNHAFELESFGYQVIATDYSLSMLEQARRKAAERSSSISFRRQDMRMLDVPERPFDVVTCLFDSIGYVATNENLLKVIKGVHSHLIPGGLFIFEFWHAPAMLKSFDAVRVRRWTIPDGQVLRISETELDYPNQQAKVVYTVYELFADGTFRSFTETQINRYFLLQEMRGWLSAGGFQLITAFNGFTADEEITDATWHVVVVAHPMHG